MKNLAGGVFAVAILAGCSGTSPGSLPGSAAATQALSPREQVPPPRFYRFYELTPANVRRMQLRGSYPTRQLHSAFVANYERSLYHRGFRPAAKHSGKVELWVNLDNELIGMTANGKKVVTSIDVQGCSYPLALKVDANENVWTACEYADSTEGGALQEYTPSGVLLAQYTSGCPGNLPSGSCANGWFSYFFDGASGGKLACGAAEEFEYEPSASSTAYGTGFICWPLGHPSAGSTLIPIWQYCSSGSCDIGSECDPVCEVWSADMDSSGNIYFTYLGDNSSCQGGGVGEVLDPGQASQSINIITSPCSLDFPGGAYVSDYSAVLNAIDQDNRVIYQYHLPLSSSSTPFRKLGPTKTDVAGLGDPDCGGFNHSDTKVAIGDAYGWIDVGKVKHNKWSVLTNALFVDNGLQCAAYTPSDK